MKKKFVSQSAFFNLRTLVGFAICLRGMSLAILGLVPSPGDWPWPSLRTRELRAANPQPDVQRLVDRSRKIAIFERFRFRSKATRKARSG